MRSYYAVLKLPAKWIVGLENQNVPFVNYIMTFFAAIFIRHFLEAYSQAENYFNIPAPLVAVDLIHYALSYITLALLLICLIYYAVRDDILKIARVVLPFFMLLLISPLLDLLLTRGAGVSILYLQPGYDINLWRTYLTFFGGFEGVSTGIRIEIACALVGFFIYFLIKGLNVALSIIYTWVCYTAIFLWGAAPYFVNWIKQFAGFTDTFTGISMIHFYLIVGLVLLGLAFYLADKKTFKIFMQDARALRILHYLLMLFLGAAIAFSVNLESISTQIYFYRDIIINLILASIAIIFSCLFALIVNNISDIEIDRISNPDRPLIKNLIAPRAYLNFGYAFAVAALFYGAMINAKALLLIAVTMASYYIYSMPPLRFKRVTLFSKLTIAFNSLALVVLGYLLVQQDVTQFPPSLFVIFLIGYTLSANFIDIKDYAGDKAENISTLPVLLGLERAKKLIGVFFLLATLSFIIYLPHLWLLPLFLLIGVLGYYFLTQEAYKEYKVFLLYLISLIILLFSLWIKNTY